MKIKALTTFMNQRYIDAPNHRTRPGQVYEVPDKYAREVESRGLAVIVEDGDADLSDPGLSGADSSDALPDDFPHRTQLADAGITTVGGLWEMFNQGHDLKEIDGIGKAYAQEITEAYDALTSGEGEDGGESEGGESESNE